MPSSSGALAYLSNGIVGLDLGWNPLVDHHAMVSTLRQAHAESGVEAQGNCPYPLDVVLIGQDGPVTWHTHTQHYDFACGELVSEGEFRDGTDHFPGTITTLCARSQPTIVLQEIRTERGLRAEFRCQPEPNAGTLTANALGGFRWTVPGGDYVGLAFHVRTAGTVIQQMTSVVPASMSSGPEIQSIRLLSVALDRGFERLRRENRQAWDEIWQHRVEAPYEDGQPAVDAAFFYLNSSIHSSSPHATGLLGLNPPTRYHNFWGHLFWDLEVHALPALLHSQPHAARALLETRFRGLEAARRNAAMNGYRGAQYPWEGGITGEEQLPTTYLQNMHEQHVSLGIALGFLRAAEAFDDPVFTRERAWPVVHAVAEWVTSRVTETTSGASICDTIGIDEALHHHDDGVWTNASAILLLRAASQLRANCGYGPEPAWESLADRIVIPIRDHCLIPFPTWEPNTIPLCPDPLMAIFPLNFPVSEQVRQTSLATLLPLAQATIGMPMHSPYHWRWAKMLGDEALARHTFERGVLDFVFAPFNQISEFGASQTQVLTRSGPYMAHCGAIVATSLDYARNRQSVLPPCN